MTRFRHKPVKRFGKEININSKIKEFYDEIKKYNVDDIICIDETSIKSFKKRHHFHITFWTRTSPKSDVN